MSHSDEPVNDGTMTLDPPGSIAVVGAGPLGIEAAMYGRFLGYDVTLIEAVSIGHSMTDQLEANLSLLPNQCLSSLAMSALQAQRGTAPQAASAANPALPMTYGQWIQEALIPLTETDLIRGRVRMPIRVTEIVHVAVQGEDAEISDIPPDYRLTLLESDGQTNSIDVEAVILAVGPSCDIQLGFEQPSPYFTRIGAKSNIDGEQLLHAGYREIAEFFAELAGRAELDLYRPRRI